MKTIKLGDKELGLKATPIAMVYYEQEFGTDLIGDLGRIQKKADQLGEGDFADFEGLKVLKITWAMNKANNLGNKFPDFDTWVAKLEEFPFGNAELMFDIVGEAVDGFFRGTAGKQEAEQEQSGD